MYFLQRVEHKETGEHDKKRHSPTDESIYSETLIEPSGARSHLVMGNERA